SPRITTAQAQVDGAATPAQWTFSANSNTASGSLSVPQGMHTVTVGAEVPCWYCSGGSYHQQASVSVCVANPGPINNLGKTTISKADNKAWVIQTGPPPSVSVATDTVTTTSRWLFEGSTWSGVGRIESVDQPCLCLKSTDALDGTAIGLAGCSRTDNTQIWQAMPSGLFFYFQNTGRGISSACLT